MLPALQDSGDARPDQTAPDRAHDRFALSRKSKTLKRLLRKYRVDRMKPARAQMDGQTTASSSSCPTDEGLQVLVRDWKHIYRIPRSVFPRIFSLAAHLAACRSPPHAQKPIRLWEALHPSCPRALRVELRFKDNAAEQWLDDLSESKTTARDQSCLLPLRAGRTRMIISARRRQAEHCSQA